MGGGGRRGRTLYPVARAYHTLSAPGHGCATASTRAPLQADCFRPRTDGSEAVLRDYIQPWRARPAGLLRHVAHGPSSAQPIARHHTTRPRIVTCPGDRLAAGPVSVLIGRQRRPSLSSVTSSTRDSTPPSPASPSGSARTQSAPPPRCHLCASRSCTACPRRRPGLQRRRPAAASRLASARRRRSAAALRRPPPWHCTASPARGCGRAAAWTGRGARRGGWSSGAGRGCGRSGAGAG